MWSELYEEQWERLVRFCFRLCRSQEQAEDLAQETFLRAMQNQALLAGLQPRQQKAWLARCAHNLFCDQTRRAAKERALLEEMLPAGQQEEPDLTAADALEGVESAALMQRLPAESRTLFVLRYEEGYTAAELAQMFGLPASTIRTRLLKARRQLKDYWTEE